MNSTQARTYLFQALALAILLGAAIAAMQAGNRRDVVMVKIDGIEHESPVVARGAACSGNRHDLRDMLEYSPVRNNSYPL